MPLWMALMLITLALGFGVIVGNAQAARAYVRHTTKNDLILVRRPRFTKETNDG